MYGVIYITTNTVNNKKYIGQAKIDKRNFNEYLGSGILLRKAIDKYGQENFTRQILYIAKTKEELDIAEKIFIKSRNAVKNSEYYNISIGGSGGNTHAGFSAERKKQFSLEQSKRSSGRKNGMYGKKPSKESIDKRLIKMKENNSNCKPIIGIFKDGSKTYYSSKKECINSLNIHQKVVEKLLKTNEPYKISKYTNKDKINNNIIGLILKWG